MNNCEHYNRGCTIIAPCCNNMFDCRLCHNDICDHEINRFEIKEVCCKKCKHIQKKQQICENCGLNMGSYFCEICCLYDNTDKGQFHCEKCGICRVGGKENFFHCDKCNACIGINLKDSHNCIENVTKNVCPICRDNMFDSIDSITMLKCGHYMHNECLKLMVSDGSSLSSYRCPICQKTIFELAEYWKVIDQEIENTPMPEEYANDIRHIQCIDCGIEADVKFHIIGLKCQNENCGSYNTKVI